ncbi:MULTISPECIES: type II CAAX endopeptidase family protein [Cyanophyceae]|uniref:CPBP family intramembrane glutamic endopeptidase n=1 Tax=Cyanophyceae TaxID=3028117 RepID=UPI0016850D69|nr:MULTISPECIES: type II CAAX endopeptidase family protein [Cyanophyceae]MBD1916141.1 CPBP family intramembrane metalloprotease [Phormidium sp. FACHB-77]MBD2031590.1 CPBP family intramembrane metalloprotease [Phormidium sp. FACHB-322]MBD2052783.1 CPBP family intramembrane metalloprotease [Leptolyngbya sp. FACHB-60]
MAACDNNPFLTLKARLVVVAFFAISTSLALVFGTLGALELLPLEGDDPILAPILYSLIFLGLCGSILLAARRSPLHLPALLGSWPRRLAWVQLLWLVVGVFLFLRGTFQVSYLGLSVVAPGLVEATLRQSLLLSAEQATEPSLYNGLMLFSVLLVRPITEEFIFRGVLLHRWGVKWGVRPAIVLTSLLFGVLHSDLIGLFVFGVVMSLLYLSTRSLLVPMVAHAINNAIASGINILANQPTANAIDALAEFRASWWLGVLCLLVSAPWILRYVVYHWPERRAMLPYFANQGCRRLG